MKKTKKRMTQRQVAKKYGFRSGFEKDVSDFLASIGREFSYEEETLEYIQPEKTRKYTPDFVITKTDGTKMYIETKGRWVTADRMKHRYLLASRPELDIRIIFQNPKAKISKGSKTTYAMYCDKYNIKYSPEAKTIPKEWLDE